MRFIFGLLMRGEVLDIQRKWDLYSGAANTRVYVLLTYLLGPGLPAPNLRWSDSIRVHEK